MCFFVVNLLCFTSEMVFWWSFCLNIFSTQSVLMEESDRTPDDHLEVYTTVLPPIQPKHCRKDRAVDTACITRWFILKCAFCSHGLRFQRPFLKADMCQSVLYAPFQFVCVCVLLFYFAEGGLINLYKIFFQRLFISYIFPFFDLYFAWFLANAPLKNSSHYLMWKLSVQVRFPKQSNLWGNWSFLAFGLLFSLIYIY